MLFNPTTWYTYYLCTYGTVHAHSRFWLYGLITHMSYWLICNENWIWVSYSFAMKIEYVLVIHLHNGVTLPTDASDHSYQQPLVLNTSYSFLMKIQYEYTCSRFWLYELITHIVATWLMSYWLICNENWIWVSYSFAMEIEYELITHIHTISQRMRLTTVVNNSKNTK